MFARIMQGVGLPPPYGIQRNKHLIPYPAFHMPGLDNRRLGVHCFPGIGFSLIFLHFSHLSISMPEKQKVMNILKILLHISSYRVNM